MHDIPWMNCARYTIHVGRTPLRCGGTAQTSTTKSAHSTRPLLCAKWPSTVKPHCFQQLSTTVWGVVVYNSCQQWGEAGWGFFLFTPLAGAIFGSHPTSPPAKSHMRIASDGEYVTQGTQHLSGHFTIVCNVTQIPCEIHTVYHIACVIR